jgi:hypothetical protein
MSNYDRSVSITAMTTKSSEASGMQSAMNELQTQLSRLADHVDMLGAKASGIMTPMPSSGSIPISDVPASSPLAVEIWRKAEDLRQANNALYDIINALDL